MIPTNENDFRVFWHALDQQWVAIPTYEPSLSYLAATPTEAIKGLLALLDGGY